MKQEVLPIKDTNILHDVQDTLLHNFRFGRRKYTIFQVGKTTLLRVSDVLTLRRSEIFEDDGSIKKNAYIHDKKTEKPNTHPIFKACSVGSVRILCLAAR